MNGVGKKKRREKVNRKENSTMFPSRLTIQANEVAVSTTIMDMKGGKK